MVLVRRSNERTLSPFLIRRVTCTGEHALECYLIGECRITKRDTDGMIASRDIADKLIALLVFFVLVEVLFEAFLGGRIG